MWKCGAWCRYAQRTFCSYLSGLSGLNFGDKLTKNLLDIVLMEERGNGESPMFSLPLFQLCHPHTFLFNWCIGSMHSSISTINLCSLAWVRLWEYRSVHIYAVTIFGSSQALNWLLGPSVSWSYYFVCSDEPLLTGILCIIPCLHLFVGNYIK